MGALERRNDPLQPRGPLEGIERLLVGDGEVAGAALIAQPRVLGPRAGVVQSGGDRVGLEDLAVLVLHDRRVGAVEDPGRAGDGERRAVTAGLDPLPRRLDADQTHRLVGDERDEHADRVRTAPDARDHAVGQAPGGLEDLGAGLVADDALQIAHHRGVGRRAHARADDVVGGLDVGDPVADGGRDGLLEGAGSVLDRLHARAEQTHALHVGLLAAHVLRAHVDDALEIEQRAGGGGGDPVLAGAGLGDDPPLAHPRGQQRLAQGIVDLVGAGVVEVLALEIDRMAGGL